MEVLGFKGVKTYCSPAIARFLRENLPFSLLVRDGCLEPVILKPGRERRIEENLAVKPVHVPHRNEIADTSAFMIRGSEKSLFYAPDMDYWTEGALDAASKADYALVDGTFFSADELGPRQKDVPHPPIEETMERLAAIAPKVFFTHLNHTNPVVTRDSQEAKRVLSRGFHVAEEGMNFSL